MSRSSFYIFLFILFGGVLAFPIYQLAESRGLLFYCNGLDESAYLQYDYSQVVSSVSGFARFGQYLVNALHERGLSAGWINLFFDIFCLVGISVLLLRILRALDFSDCAARVGTAILFGIPLIFLGINPIVRRLSYLVQTSDMVYWFTMPDASSHPFMRSPEPQVSFLLMMFAVFVSLRVRSYLVAYIVVPFLYPFLAIPYLFSLLSLHLRSLGGSIKSSHFIYPLVAFLMVSGLVGVHANLFVSEYVKGYMVETHLPLVSGMGIVALILHIFISAKLTPDERYISWILVLSVFAAVNIQVISGWLIQAANYEQYWGAMVVALMVVLLARLASEKSLRTLGLGCAFLTLLGAAFTFRYNFNIYQKIPLSSELISAIQKDPGEVLINDIAVSSWLSMLYPKQAALFFTLTRSYKTLGDENFERYLCAKKEIEKDPVTASKFTEVLLQMDAAYSSGHKYAPLYTNLRKPLLKAERDLRREVGQCDLGKFKIFLVK